MYLISFPRHLTSNNGMFLKSVSGKSRFLKMTPFNESYTTFYQSAIVSMAWLYHVPCLRYLTLKNIVTWNIGQQTFTVGIYARQHINEIYRPWTVFLLLTERVYIHSLYTTRPRESYTRYGTYRDTVNVWYTRHTVRSMTHTAINCGNLWRNFLAQ